VTARGSTVGGVHARNLNRPQTFHGVGAREAMRERLRIRREAKAGTQIGFLDWALEVPEVKTGKLDFDRFPPQIELYREGVNDPECVVMKSTQVGVSAWAVRWALYHSDTKGLTGLYVCPTARDMWDFSTLRVGPIIRNSPRLSRRQKPDDPDNKGMKGIGLGTVVFRGSESPRGLESVDADHMVFDEYELLEPTHIPIAERRTGASLYGYKRRIGWPFIPNAGIDKLYTESDQRRWNVKCGSCNEWQDISFNDNVDLSTGERVCRRCRSRLDLRKGQWVAKYNESGRSRGYHVTQLIMPMTRMGDIIKAAKKRSPTEKQSFMNRDLGVAWAPEEGRLSDAAYDAAVSAGGGYALAPANVHGLVTMGVDVATVRNLNVRISLHNEDGSKIALWLGEVESFNELDKLWNRFAVSMAVIDHLPEGRLARAFAERHRGQVYLCALTDTTGPHMKKPFEPDDDAMFVSVNRTVAIDTMLSLIRGQLNRLPINPPEDYKEHLQAPTRIVLNEIEMQAGAAKNQSPRGTRVFYRSAGADDYAMAEVFDVVAKECWDYRTLLHAAGEGTFTAIEDELEFERSHLANPIIEPDYYEGGRSADDYYGMDPDQRYYEGRD